MILKKKRGSYCKHIVVLFLIFVPSTFFAQINVYGDWRIDKILGLNDLNEYVIVRQDEKNRWGNMLTLNLDGTFLCRNLPGCGSDVYQNVSGKFIIIDDVHIRFVLHKVSSSGYHKDGNSESYLSKDLGVFYIYKDLNSIRLILSNGILQDDKDKMLYTQMLDSFSKNWKLYDYVWNNTTLNQPEEIVKDCKDKRNPVNLSNCKIVFSKNEDYGNVFLLRENEDFYYVVYNALKKKVSLAYPKK